MEVVWLSRHRAKILKQSVTIYDDALVGVKLLSKCKSASVADREYFTKMSFTVVVIFWL